MLALAALVISVEQCATPQSSSDVVVVVDAGHGGREVGAPSMMRPNGSKMRREVNFLIWPLPENKPAAPRGSCGPQQSWQGKTLKRIAS